MKKNKLTDLCNFGIKFDLEPKFQGHKCLKHQKYHSGNCC